MILLSINKLSKKKKKYCFKKYKLVSMIHLKRANFSKKSYDDF